MWTPAPNVQDPGGGKADVCPACGARLNPLRVCSACGHHAALTAAQRIKQLTDRGTFHEYDRHMWSGNPIHFSAGVTSYDKQLAQAQAATGLLDAVVTGRARVMGIDIVLAVFDFRFLGGSMGSLVGEKMARAFDSGRRERLPVIAVCSSGGARIQEGMVALFQMAKTTLCAARLREQGLPLLTVLTDPTMGGVLASFASMGDVILAEPNARISFVGPRVHEKAMGDAVPPGRAEFALTHGTIDAVVVREHLRSTLGQLAAVLRPQKAARTKAAAVPRRFPFAGSSRPVWETVELARHPDRPTGRDLVQRVFHDVFELHGDRSGEDDDSIMAGVGTLRGRAVVVVAQDRRSANGGRTRASGYRKAQRAFALAERFSLPLITLVDTPGAATDAEAEAAGITGAVAESLARLGRLRTVVVNVVVGEGGSGGALALSVGDRLLMLENAIFSVIGPEAASTILYRDAAHAHEVAGQLKLTARDLFGLRLVDRVVAEQPAGHEAPDIMSTMLRQALVEELAALDHMPIKTVLSRREARFRHTHGLRGRLQLFMRSSPEVHGENAKQA
ncbi:MAG: acetyl-CoA carboxylase carboxyltransferase subunit alpha/beta [Candidatus Dormibacteraeota bacterium]|nr:acetyl-CoA carboxylase carboxyltransferase subunit alpha/beta [Candidatus Dormibacteraeota bacterium]